MRLSVIIIAKNEEERIADAINSVDFADEVIVIDNGSTDRTAEIVKYLKAKVFTCETDSFSQLRNFGLEKTTGGWILYVDADERVTSSLREEIIQLANNPITQYGAYILKRKNFYFGNNEWPYIEKIERLFRKDALKGWRGKLHESPIIDGEVGELDGYLLHYTHRDLTSMLEKTIEWSKIEAELRLKTGHPKMIWWRFLRVMATAFFDFYIRQGGWKVGAVGLIESIYQAFSMFVTYARLWEIQQEQLKTQSSKLKNAT